MGKIFSATGNAAYFATAGSVSIDIFSGLIKGDTLFERELRTCIMNRSNLLLLYY